MYGSSVVAKKNHQQVRIDQIISEHRIHKLRKNIASSVPVYTFPNSQNGVHGAKTGCAERQKNYSSNGPVH